MSIHFYSEKEEYKKEESINNYKHLFIDYVNKQPSLTEALNQLFISEGAKKEELNELVEDILTKCKKIIDINFHINFHKIKKKYPKISYDEALIISSYTCESKDKKFNPYTILNINLISDDREKGIINVSKYFFILLNSLRKLTKYYPDKKSPFLYRCIKRQVSINYDQFNPNLVPYISGQIKTFWAFTSTSINILTKFLYEDKNNNIKCGTLFTLTGDIWGYDITLFNYYKENEILLEPERKFKIEQVIPPINQLINIRCNMQDTPLVLSDFGYQDYITIKYKIFSKDEKIRIFGDKFVENNTGFFPWSNKGQIRYKNNILNLQTHLDLKEINKDEILEIKLEGISDISDISYMFDNCDRLLSIPDIFMWDTSSIYNMEYLFYGCRSLLSFPKIDYWNTENVTSMKYMFGKTYLNSLPDISNWNTSNLKYVEGMLYGFESDTYISSWNIYNIVDFYFIYYSNENIPDKLKNTFIEYYKKNKFPLKKIIDLDPDIKLRNPKYQNYRFNIGIIGTFGCGKSSICHYFEKGEKLEYPENLYFNIPHFKTIKIGNKFCKITLFDFPGEQRMFLCHKNELSELHAIILAFSLLGEYLSNIYDLKFRYLDIFLDENKMKQHIIYVVGNKVDDKENRKIFKKEIMGFINEYSLNYFETSAYTGENINNVFESIILDLLKIYS